MTAPTPPSMIALRWCPVCGRDDRKSNLPDVHVKPNWKRGGSNCPGTVETVVYEIEAEVVDGELVSV